LSYRQVAVSEGSSVGRPGRHEVGHGLERVETPFCNRHGSGLQNAVGRGRENARYVIDFGMVGRLKHAPIDHILISKSLAKSSRVVAAWEGTTLDGRRLSDHSGLVVEF
jgi:endonuclease/exonuclease/phosphatase family metal-dependent hydrolase